MKKIVMSTVAALVVAATSAQAQSVSSGGYPQAYVGGDVMFWKLTPEVGSSLDATGLRVRGGVQFNDYLAVEAHLGTGGSDTVNDFKIKLDSLAGAYAKGMLPVGEAFRFYGLAGVTHVKLKATDSRDGMTYSATDSSFSYGAGAEFDVMPALSIGADYIRYLDKSDNHFDAASIGVRYRF